MLFGADLMDGEPLVEKWVAWIKSVAVLLCFAILIPVLINVLIDPYDLFRVSPLGTGPALNQRFQGIRMLEKNPRRFNVLLMGTSIMGINDPAVVDRLVPGAHTYNLGFFLATSSDLLEAAKYLQQHDELPSHIIVGVDTFLFVTRDAQLRQQFLFPPEVQGKSAINWWFDAAYASSIPQAFNKVIDRFGTYRSVTFNLDRGYYSLPSATAVLRTDPVRHAAKAFPPAPAIPSDAHLVADEFYALGQLVSFFESKDVKVLWLIQPNSSVLRSAYGEKHYQRLMARIRAQLRGDVVDLSDFEHVGDDPMSWYDLKHFTPDTGRRVLVTAIHRSTTFSNFSLEPISQVSK